jgi:exodeoxyribonuclease VIII
MKKLAKSWRIWRWVVTDYHSIDALSNSSLSVLYGNGKGDPAGFHARFIAKTLRHEETDAMRLGSAVHMLALEPERFASEYFVTEGPINPATKKPYGRGTIAYKDWLDSLAIEPNRKVIIEEDWCESLEIAKAFQSHPNIVSIMASKTEKVFERGYEMQYLVEGQDPIRLKCKPDCVIPSEGLIIDLKTTSDPHPDAWKWSAEEYGYHRQAAIYLQAMEAYYGKQFRFLFGVVRSRAPYEVGVYELDDDSISRGWSQVESLIAEYAQRKREDNWRSEWQTGIHSLNVPERRRK